MALGYLTEGPQYYTYALPRPQLASRQVQDAERCVRALFVALDQRSSALERVRPRLRQAATSAL